MVVVEPTAVEETVEDLVRAIELPPGSLQQTADYPNRFAARAEAPLFHTRASLLKARDSPAAPVVLGCLVRH